MPLIQSSLECKARRRAVLETLRSNPPEAAVALTDPAKLIREDRRRALRQAARTRARRGGEPRP